MACLLWPTNTRSFSFLLSPSNTNVASVPTCIHYFGHYVYFWSYKCLKNCCMLHTLSVKQGCKQFMVVSCIVWVHFLLHQKD